MEYLQLSGERRFLSIAEFAQQAGISAKSAYKHVRLGRLPVIRLGRRLLVDMAALGR